MNSPKLWTPRSAMKESQRAALTVGVKHFQPMGLKMFRPLMEQKFRRLIEADPMGARVAMDISVEVAPELWTIAQMHPMKSWPTQLVYSDSICNLLSLIDWTIENASGPRPPSPDPLSFREILEEMYPVTPSERVPFENFIAKAHADRARSARLTLAPR